MIFRYQNKQILLILSMTLAVKQKNKQTNKQFSVLALGGMLPKVGTGNLERGTGNGGLGTSGQRYSS